MTHEQQAKQALGDLHQEIEQTQSHLTELQTKKSQLEDRHAGIYPDGPADEIEQVETELMQTTTRLKSTRTHLDKLQHKVPELEAAIDAAKRKDHLEKMQADAEQFNELAEQFNEAWKKCATIGQRLVENNIDGKLQMQNESLTQADIGLMYSIPGRLAARRFRKIFQAMVKETELISPTDYAERQKKDAA